LFPIVEVCVRLYRAKKRVQDPDLDNLDNPHEVKHWVEPAIIPYGWGMFEEDDEVLVVEREETVSSPVGGGRVRTGHSVLHRGEREQIKEVDIGQAGLQRIDSLLTDSPHRYAGVSSSLRIMNYFSNFNFLLCFIFNYNISR